VDLTDAAAVKQAARGDADAYMVLVQRYRAPLIAYIHGKTRLRDEAEDLAQDVFTKAWISLPRLREPGAFGPWLYRMASNAVVSAARKRRPVELERTSEPAVDDRAVDDSLDGGDNEERAAAVHAAVGRLPENQRMVVALRHFTGMSIDEIATACELPAGTVRSRLSRAYATLRDRLSQQVEA
jgi:RNA polymerase sigma-70 factor (ECF subfamily)